jgi:hypothetical protein
MSHKPFRYALATSLLLLAALALARPATSSEPLARSAAEDSMAALEWEQVNVAAFGLPGLASEPPYSNQEAYEVLAFDNRLYVGMEASNALGARLWRSRSIVGAPAAQNDWEEIAADASGLPFGNPNLAQNDHIDSLAAFQGLLYASTANRGTSTYGTLVYRADPATQPLSWTQVITPGFGDIANTNFKDMQVFGGELCGGTQNGVSGAQVWCTPDGLTWTQRNTSGFGDPRNRGIWSSGVFNGALYVGVNYYIDEYHQGGRLFRASTLHPAAWSEVYSDTSKASMVDILGTLDGHLYIATRSVWGTLVLRSHSGDAGTWQVVSMRGLDGTRRHTGTLVDGAAIYRNRLFVAIYDLQLEHGVTVWQTNGRPGDDGQLTWEQVGSVGLGDPANVLAQLVAFDDYLYAWTTNYTSGQQVRRLWLPPLRRVALPVVVAGSAALRPW